jgi:hypothetical protein
VDRAGREHLPDRRGDGGRGKNQRLQRVALEHLRHGCGRKLFIEDGVQDHEHWASVVKSTNFTPEE